MHSDRRIISGEAFQGQRDGLVHRLDPHLVAISFKQIFPYDGLTLHAAGQVDQAGREFLRSAGACDAGRGKRKVRSGAFQGRTFSLH